MAPRDHPSQRQGQLRLDELADSRHNTGGDDIVMTEASLDATDGNRGTAAVARTYRRRDDLVSTQRRDRSESPHRGTRTRDSRPRDSSPHWLTRLQDQLARGIFKRGAREDIHMAITRDHGLILRDNMNKGHAPNNILSSGPLRNNGTLPRTRLWLGATLPLRAAMPKRKAPHL